MRWTSHSLPPFLTVRAHAVDGMLDAAFRATYPWRQAQEPTEGVPNSG